MASKVIVWRVVRSRSLITAPFVSYFAKLVVSIATSGAIVGVAQTGHAILRRCAVVIRNSCQAVLNANECVQRSNSPSVSCT